MQALNLEDIFYDPPLLADARRGDLPALNDAELAALAWEGDERGAAAAAAGLLDALEVRHANDRVTRAMLKALRLNHLPALVRSGARVWSV